MNATSYTVLEVVSAALSKIGVDGATTEVKNLEDAQRNLNLLVGAWSADPDYAVNRILPLAGFATLDEVIDVPPEFIAAMVLNLAVLLAADYDQKVTPVQLKLAQDSLDNLKLQNVRRISGSIPSNRR